MRVLKFGGKSLETPQKAQNICNFIKKIYKTDKNLIIVVSARGKTTDNLNALSKKYYEKSCANRELAVLLSCGETISSALLAIMLNDIGVPAKSFQAWQLNIKTHGDYESSLIFSIDKTKILECFKKNTVAVVSGFQGVNSKNEITLLGRGGSDTTAAALAAAFQTNVELYSDFNGIFAGDPKLAPFKKIQQLSFLQMQTASDSGAKVINPRAVALSQKSGISILAKSSNQPNNKGTIIQNIETNNIILVEKDNLCQISIVFSHSDLMQKQLKNVLFCIKNANFHNFYSKNAEISFLIDATEKEHLLKLLYSKLKLLKKE